MKRNLKVAGLVLLGFAAVALASVFMRPRDHGTLNAALVESRKTGKPILVDFWAPWCGPCQEMRQTTWKDERVRRAINDYVFLELNVDQEEKVASQYGVSAIPHIAVLDSDGRVLKANEGLMSADELLEWLHASGSTGPVVRLLDPQR
jgi:thioredoxin-like negative regulator of GroEL